MSQLLMSQIGYGGGVSGLIGTMSLNTVFFFFEGIPNTMIDCQLIQQIFLLRCEVEVVVNGKKTRKSAMQRLIVTGK